MKTLFFSALLAALPPAFAQAAEPGAAQAQTELKVVASEVGGVVKFRAGPEAKWDVLRDGTILAVGTEVLTGPGGHARLQVGPGIALVLKPFSRITLAALALDGKADEATVRATLAKQYGRVEFDVHEAGFRNDFKIASPNGVMAVKGTAGEHDNFGADERVVGAPRNRDHAIQYANAVAGYRAFLSANEGVATGLPSVDAFAALLKRLDPAQNQPLFARLSNLARGGDLDASNAAEWLGAMREAEVLGAGSPAGRLALENAANQPHGPAGGGDGNDNGNNGHGNGDGRGDGNNDGGGWTLLGGNGGNGGTLNVNGGTGSNPPGGTVLSTQVH